MFMAQQLINTKSLSIKQIALKIVYTNWNTNFWNDYLIKVESQDEFIISIKQPTFRHVWRGLVAAAHSHC